MVQAAEHRSSNNLPNALNLSAHWGILAQGKVRAVLVVAQQIGEAFPWDETPRYLARDRDGIYGTTVRRRIRGIGHSGPADLARVDPGKMGMRSDSSARSGGRASTT